MQRLKSFLFSSTIIFISLIALSFFGNCAVAQTDKSGYKIDVTVDGMPNQKFFLGFYYGDQRYMKDSTMSDSKGKMTFEGSEPLDKGFYLIIFPGKGDFFDFIVDKQRMSFKTTKRDVIKNMVVKNSEENRVMYEHMQLTMSLQIEARDLQNKLKAETDPDEKSRIQQRLKNIQQQLDTYRSDVIEKHPDFLLSHVFQMMADPTPPPPPVLEDGSIDSTFQFRYYRDHFLDGIDFSDDRMVRTPVFNSRFERYMENLVPKHPDSIISAAEMMLQQTETGSEMQKFIVVYFTNKYSNPKIMGMDKVFVHMVDNYYAKDKAYWADSATIYRMTDRAKDLKPTLLGNPAPNFILKDGNGKYVRLSEHKHDYTILFFYDPDCGHCKKEAPKLVDAYNELKGDFDIDVISISTTPEEEKWRKFLKEKEFDQFKNLWDPEFKSNFRELYNIDSTPKVFILDKDHEIIGNRIGVEQIDELIHRHKELKEKK